jgi:allantoate deiminase
MPDSPPNLAAAETVMDRCATLGGFSEEPDRLTRRYGTPPMREVNEAVVAWMAEAGMLVHHDVIGNIVGRYEAARPSARTLLLGSHLDTVRDAGRYDGPLGVMVALACVAALHARGERLPYALEVYGFADEEGLRYRSGYLGSSVVAGTFDPAALASTDADGIALAEAIRAFGGDPDALEAALRAPGDLLGYLEVHIEQGPVLEARGLALGVVSAIQGQTRIALTFTGQAGHAGTVPMRLRHDALVAAAEFIVEAERLARDQEGIVATIGQLAVEPGASNVIPGRAVLSLDVRHPDDAARDDACRALEAHAREIAAHRGVALDWQPRGASASVPCDPRLSQLLARALEDTGHPPVRLPSGAGHDAVPMSTIALVAMLFVRCAGGVSHHPAEAVTVADVAAAIAATERFLALLAVEEGKPDA